MTSYQWQDQIVPWYHFPQLDSTNDTSWELLQAGYTPPFVVTADRQTAGKGQWGRHWASGEGGLYLSLGLAPAMTVEQPSHLTIATVFGVTELLSCYHIPVQIKWINDIFLQSKKLAGVLTETRLQNQQLKAVVIGIGINWDNPVPETGIALKDYFNETATKANLSLPTPLAKEPFASQLPPQLITLMDLKRVALTGLLFGYDCYQQGGITPILPQYEARLIHSSYERDGDLL